MANRYLTAIDQGTTSTRCMLFDQRARLAAVAQREHRQYFPKPAWVEHDATQIWRNVARLIPQTLREFGVDSTQVVALGIANKRETSLLSVRHNGVPVAHALVRHD